MLHFVADGAVVQNLIEMLQHKLAVKLCSAGIRKSYMKVTQTKISE